MFFPRQAPPIIRTANSGARPPAGPATVALCNGRTTDLVTAAAAGLQLIQRGDLIHSPCLIGLFGERGVSVSPPVPLFASGAA